MSGSGIFEIARPLPPGTVLRPVKRVPREQFGVVGPFPLTIQDFQALVYPDATLHERKDLLEGVEVLHHIAYRCRRTGANQQPGVLPGLPYEHGRGGLETDIELRLNTHEVGKLLTTIPGVSTLTAARIIAETGDPAQFRSATAFASYIGAVPRLHQSGKKRYSGKPAIALGNAQCAARR